MMKKTSMFIVLFIFLAFISLLVIIGLSSMDQPKEDNTQLTSLSENQKEEVMMLAVAYVEDNYGSDYSINGDVEIGSYGTSRDGVLTQYTYPVASFRTPAD
jgi:hypothetical protein